MKTKMIHAILFAVLISAITGCATPKGKDAQAKRLYSQNMSNDALVQLYRHEAGARREIASAPGYGVFEARQTATGIGSTGNAYGIVRNNSTGEETYMKAFSAGAGLGLGIKDFRAIVVFKDSGIMDEFVNKGWVFGATATADAVNKGDGASASGTTAFDGRLKVYTFTNTGLMAGASLRGLKVWKDKDLN